MVFAIVGVGPGCETCESVRRSGRDHFCALVHGAVWEHSAPVHVDKEMMVETVTAGCGQNDNIPLRYGDSRIRGSVVPSDRIIAD